MPWYEGYGLMVARRTANVADDGGRACDDNNKSEKNANRAFIDIHIMECDKNAFCQKDSDGDAARSTSEALGFNARVPIVSKRLDESYSRLCLRPERGATSS